MEPLTPIDAIRSTETISTPVTRDDSIILSIIQAENDWFQLCRGSFFNTDHLIYTAKKVDPSQDLR